MDEASEESSREQQADTSNADRKKFALTILSNSFTKYLRDIMTRSDFDVQEKELHHPTFKRFMFLTLSKSANILYKLLHSLSKTMNEDELKGLISKSDKTELEPKVDHAMQLFSSDLPQFLKNAMRSAGYLTSDTEDSHDCYIAFFSSAISALTTLFIRVSSVTPDFQASEHLKKRKFSEPYALASNKKETDSSSQCKISISKAPLPYNKTSSIHHIASTKKHLIYRVSKSPSNDILIKVVKSQNPVIKVIKNLDNELKIGKMIVHPSFRFSCERTVHDNKQALMLEWVKGGPISEIDFVKTFNIGFFLEVARKIVSALLAIHMKNIIHNNLTCDHILMDLESNSLKVIGYGSSISSGGKNIHFSNEELLDKDLRYISPEQTGRVKREVDFRSDFYSLGIVFYRLLTGIYPLESNDDRKLIHMHILQDPLPVSKINPIIPDALSDMVSRLLQKNSEERYLSAKGIIHDLDFMISEYPSDEKLTSVLLQQHDIPENLLLPQKLYGRCDQYKSLLSAFDRVTFTSYEVVFVAGESGTGKTSIVLELYKSIAQREGIFIYGKFHFSMSEPYGGLRAAINTFCDDILLRDKTTIAKYKHQIQDSVGDEGIILTNFISNLHLLIDRQPNISDSFGQDAKNRFIYVFVKFIKAICSVGPPIVLVLEDLHWLDLDSSNLLSSLLTDQSNKNFMFIGTYRENETSNTDRLFEEMKEKNTSMTQVRLANVDHEIVNDLISDALCVCPLETYSLTAFLYEKTKGNLFFLNQMLKSLSEQGSIFFCNNTNKWTWDASIVSDNNFSSSAIELVIEKINSLDSDTQDVLKYASCLGHSFSLGTIKYLVKNDKCIEDAICTGMITQQKGSNSIYKFAHDQIQQAAFFSITKKHIKKIFWSIGQRLLISFSSQELDDNIFVVARLLYHSASLASDENGRLKIASLLMQAGKKAMSSNALEQSYKYFYNGKHLLGRECWKTHYDLTLELHNLTAKSAFCVSDYSTMNVMIEEISENVTSKLQLIQSCSLQIKQYKDKRMFEKAISSGICILDNLGENIAMNPDAETIQSTVLLARGLVNEMTNEEVMEHKVLEDEVLLSVMMILSDIIYSCFLVNKKLLAFVSARMTILTVKYGLSKYSAYGLCIFGVTLCDNGGDKIGYRVGKLSLEILEKMNEKESKPFVQSLFYGIISSWYSSIHDAIVPLKKMYYTGFEIGSLECVALGAASYCMFAVLIGTNLATLLDDIEEFRPTMPVASKLFSCINQAVLNFHDLDMTNPAIIQGKFFDYEVCYDENEKGYDISRCLVVCIFTACTFNDYDLALKLVKTLRPLNKYISYFFFGTQFLFYDGLVSLVVENLEDEEKKMLIQRAKENITKLRKYSEDAPMNYLNKVHLLEAELAVLYNNDSKAISNFQSAIDLSIKYHFLHEEALACERAAMYYIKSDSVKEATNLLLQSFKCYKTWGAIAKLKSLILRFPTIFKEKGNTFDALKSLEINMEVENHSTASISMLS